MTTTYFRLLAGPVLLGALALPAAAQTVPKAKHTPTTSSMAAQRPVSIDETVVASRANALTTNMVQALGLTPAQAEKVRTVNANSVRNVEAARQRYADTPTKLRGSIEDIGLARLEQLKDVLTPAQFNRYQQKREEKMGVPTVRGYQGTPPPGMGGGRGGDE